MLTTGDIYFTDITIIVSESSFRQGMANIHLKSTASSSPNMYKFIALLTIVFMSGCDSGIESPAPGNISGKITLLDTASNPLRDHSGLTVSIEGSQFSATSDSTGAWTLQRSEE